MNYRCKQHTRREERVAPCPLDLSITHFSSKIFIVIFQTHIQTYCSITCLFSCGNGFLFEYISILLHSALKPHFIITDGNNPSWDTGTALVCTMQMKPAAKMKELVHWVSSSPDSKTKQMENLTGEQQALSEIVQVIKMALKAIQMTHSAGNQPMAWPVHCTYLMHAHNHVTWAVGSVSFLEKLQTHFSSSWNPLKSSLLIRTLYNREDQL